jgi:hypothetical protein
MKFDARHPEESMLALLAGGEVAWWDSLETRWHARFCPQCKRQLALFRSTRTELLVSGADLSRSLDVQPGECDTTWNALEAEMRANIRLGLTAGALASEASGHSEQSEDVPSLAPFAPWRWAVVCGAMAFVLTAGWWLRSPGGAPLPMASAPALEIPVSGQAGQGTGRGAGIQLLVPVANVSRTETDFDGSTRSRVIDGETGQVTLQQVYVE